MFELLLLISIILIILGQLLPETNQKKPCQQKLTGRDESKVENHIIRSLIIRRQRPMLHSAEWWAVHHSHHKQDQQG